MTGKIIEPFVTEIYRDIRNGVPIDRAVAERATPKARADFIASMRQDFKNAGPDRTYSVVAELREMGMPREWIREAMDLPADHRPEDIRAHLTGLIKPILDDLADEIGEAERGKLMARRARKLHAKNRATNRILEALR